MRMLLGRIYSFFRVFALWGVIFLVLALGVWKVPLSGIYQEAVSGGNYVNLLCMYFLISVPLLLILSVPGWIFSEVRFYEWIQMDVEATMRSPYAALNIIPVLFHARRTNTQRMIWRSDFGAFILTFIEMILWWTIVLAGSYYIVISDNVFKTVISQQTITELYINIGTSLLVLLIISLIDKIADGILRRIWKEQEYRERKRIKRNSNKDNYYERHPEKKPSCCSSCGGPYPLCRDGCNLFDD